MSDPVRIYWNSRKKLFSVQTLQTYVTLNERGWRDAFDYSNFTATDPILAKTIKTKTVTKWKVTDYTTSINLKRCELPVNQFGRQRVLLEHRKNVHAWIQGYALTWKPFVQTTDDWVLISYNPYRSQYFTGPSGQHVVNAQEILATVNSQSQPVIKAILYYDKYRDIYT